MSLFSSIAHSRTAGGSAISFRGLAAFAMALVLGATVGAAVAGGGASDVAGTSPVARIGLPHEAFIRLNTTDMDHLSPAVTSSAVEPASTVDPFLYWNTTALDNLVPAATAESKVSEEFLRWNVDSLEYSTPAYIEQPSGPR